MVQLSKKHKYETVIKHEMGYSSREIAKDMNISKKFVLLWIKRYQKTETVKRQIRLGRKRKTKNEYDKKILTEIIKNDTNMTAEDIKFKSEEQNINLSKTTVIHLFHNACNPR